MAYPYSIMPSEMENVWIKECAIVNITELIKCLLKKIL